MKLSFELYRSGAFGFKPENIIVLSRALFLQLPSNTQKNELFEVLPEDETGKLLLENIINIKNIESLRVATYIHTLFSPFSLVNQHL